MNEKTVSTAVLILLLLGPTVASAGQAEGIVISQLTVTEWCWGSGYPSLDASGHLVAFESSCSFVGNNNSINIFTMNADGTAAVQLTDAFPYIAQNPALNGNGKTIAVASNADLVSGENTDASGEVFIMDVDGTNLTQLTHTINDGAVIGPGNYLPNLNIAGDLVVFTSNFDLVTGQNADRSNEIYVIKEDGSDLRQLTSTPNNATSYDGALDASGKRVLFGSEANWTGANPDWIRQLFLMRIDGSDIIQLTNISVWPGVNEVALDAGGTTAAFESTNDVVPNGNADGNFEIFLMDIKQGKIVQVTDTILGRGCHSPSLSANGRIVAFACDRDLIGSNPDHNEEIFLATVTGNIFK